jgi:hypothetical protein
MAYMHALLLYYDMQQLFIKEGVKIELLFFGM